MNPLSLLLWARPGTMFTANIDTRHNDFSTLLHLSRAALSRRFHYCFRSCFSALPFLTMSVPFTALFEIIRQNKRAAAAQKLQSFFNDLDKQRFCRNTTMRVAQLSLGVMQSYMSTKASNTAFPQRYADTKYRIDTLDTMNALFLEIYVDANFHLWFAEDFLSKDVRGWRKEDGSTYDEHFERLRRELVVQVNECTSLWREVINIRNQFRDEVSFVISRSQKVAWC